MERTQYALKSVAAVDVVQALARIPSGIATVGAIAEPPLHRQPGASQRTDQSTCACPPTALREISERPQQPSRTQD